MATRKKAVRDEDESEIDVKADLELGEDDKEEDVGEFEFEDGEKEEDKPELSMNVVTTLVVLRGLSQLYASVTTQYASAKIQALTAIADGIESGANVDAAMRKVADALKTGELKEWDAVAKSINENSRLLNLPATDSHAPPQGATAPAPLGNANVIGPSSRPPISTPEELARATGAGKSALTAGATAEDLQRQKEEKDEDE
jgi:hypothetical protein